MVEILDWGENSRSFRNYHFYHNKITIGRFDEKRAFIYL